MGNCNRFTMPTQQKGAVLLVSLMLLIVLTMLGVSATQTTTIETRMAYNMQEYIHAFEAAEVGVGIVRAYPLEKYVEISESEKNNPNQEVPFTTELIVRDAENAYLLQYRTERVNGTFPDPSGKYGAGSAALAHFISESIGRSTEADDAPTVTLRAGAAQPAPISKNVITTSIQ